MVNNFSCMHQLSFLLFCFWEIIVSNARLPILWYVSFGWGRQEQKCSSSRKLVILLVVIALQLFSGLRELLLLNALCFSERVSSYSCETLEEWYPTHKKHKPVPRVYFFPPPGTGRRESLETRSESTRFWDRSEVAVRYHFVVVKQHVAPFELKTFRDVPQAALCGSLRTG